MAKVFEVTSIPPDMDLTSPESGKEVAKYLLNEASNYIEQETELRMPYFLVVLSQDPRSKVPYKEPSIKTFNPNDGNYDHFMSNRSEYLGIIQAVCRHGKAVCAGLVTEVWMVPDKDVDAWVGRYEQHPQRWVELHVHVNHKALPSPVYLRCRIQEGEVRTLGPVIEDKTVSAITGLYGNVISL